MKASESQVGGDHYSRFEIQPSEFIFRNGLDWCEGNVIKYVCRHRAKNGRQDLEKALHYLQLLIEWEYPDAPLGAIHTGDYECGQCHALPGERHTHSPILQNPAQPLQPSHD